MSAISAMPEAITQWLAGQETLSNIRFLTEFPAQNKAVPLRQATVAVGLGSVSITDKFIENDDGVLERQEYCRTAAMRMRFDIHVPFSDGGSRCHDIFTLVLDLLTFASDLNLRASGCKDITAHRDTDAFLLEAWADVTADFCPAQTTGLILASFLPKDLLCGSHISNQDIHLSAAQKSRLDAPFRIGTYMGTGAASQSFDLGLRPSAVFVFATTMPATFVDFAAGKAQALFGLATQQSANHGMMGIELTANGFRLRSGGSQDIGANTASLNMIGVEYGYFAMV